MSPTTKCCIHFVWTISWAVAQIHLLSLSDRTACNEIENRHHRTALTPDDWRERIVKILYLHVLFSPFSVFFKKCIDARRINLTVAQSVVNLVTFLH